mmetsp:Transcript_19099/g.30786  ORF Transcript_19099/g.30786 Transcript_19099/m.30786 type:complete len:89 (-) Transcript_19099:269-535(-)
MLESQRMKLERLDPTSLERGVQTPSPTGRNWDARIYRDLMVAFEGEEQVVLLAGCQRKLRRLQLVAVKHAGSRNCSVGYTVCMALRLW